QINLAELAHPFHPHAAQIDLSPLRLRLFGQRLAQFTLCRRASAAFQQLSDGFPAMADRTFQPRFLAQRGHDLLARAASGADGSDQRPVFVGLAIDEATVAAQKHDSTMPQSRADSQRTVLHYTDFGEGRRAILNETPA